MATNIGPDEHAWTAGLRDAATAPEGDARDDSATMLNNGEITRPRVTYGSTDTL
jgi:hypothetical protein